MNGPYSEKVMDHFMEPRNMGDIKDADAVGTVGNPACGDVMRLYIKVEDDKIKEAKFKTFGCGAAIATSSMATEMIKDKSLTEASNVTNEAVAEALDGLPPNKMHCSVLAQEAIEAAIKNYKEKK
ncbi:Fe-S cluster assembly scaffold protein NifU [Candidatus Scalindua japonica]